MSFGRGMQADVLGTDLIKPQPQASRRDDSEQNPTASVVWKDVMAGFGTDLRSLDRTVLPTVEWVESDLRLMLMVTKEVEGKIYYYYY